MIGKTIETPPVLSGGSQQQLRQLYGYLYRLSEHLNLALTQVNKTEQALPAAAKEEARASAQANTYSELKSLIVNTAGIVRKELDAVSSRLQGEYESVSEEWGSFRENFQTTVTETARDVLRQYDYDGALQALNEQAAGFAQYRLQTEGFIRQGFVELDEMGLPVLGIAIGQNLTGQTVTIDGVNYEQFDGGQSCAFYTAEKVSFRVGGQEMAYVSNNKMFIRDIEVVGKAILGDWMLTTHNGFAVKWIGGDG